MLFACTVCSGTFFSIMMIFFHEFVCDVEKICFLFPQMDGYLSSLIFDLFERFICIKRFTNI